MRATTRTPREIICQRRLAALLMRPAGIIARTCRSLGFSRLTAKDLGQADPSPLAEPQDRR